MGRSLHLAQSSMNALDDRSWNSERRIASLEAPRLRISNYQDAWLVLENLSNAVHAQAPQIGYLSRREMAAGENVLRDFAEAFNSSEFCCRRHLSQSSERCSKRSLPACFCASGA